MSELIWCPSGSCFSSCATGCSYSVATGVLTYRPPTVSPIFSPKIPIPTLMTTTRNSIPRQFCRVLTYLEQMPSLQSQCLNHQDGNASSFSRTQESGHKVLGVRCQDPRHCLSHGIWKYYAACVDDVGVCSSSAINRTYLIA